jgi:hypothetical protein
LTAQAPLILGPTASLAAVPLQWWWRVEQSKNIDFFRSSRHFLVIVWLCRLRVGLYILYQYKPACAPLVAYHPPFEIYPHWWRHSLTTDVLADVVVQCDTQTDRYTDRYTDRHTDIYSVLL